ncbi:MAG: iron-containing alcohol dehydrogenase family protein [Bifidobacterium merycicum]|uniref:iron-containing alcohol dehydrogenase family protein n=1 Tax=Bifidobacterium merycicum TaxID=78345 RepID=UPI002E79DACC|nr:iron-containing alcohol dehydrogenase family protein [Bifidobacterium merycicum]MEE0905090.1 iron-containing alcohol dehydrogenase family protein [Bifidobacterium adolescentis]MEE1294360.1 iron-containing alcohol dehydrogenase family protein [Bifidobacterium merycicum]
MSSFIRENDVRSGPDRYIGELGAAKNIGRFLADYRHPVIVTGKRSWQVFSEYADIVPDYPVFRYDGSATLRNAKELAASISVEGADAIVAIGAGKLSDTAKNVAEILDADLIMVPTLAATCAAYSALSVNYDDRHRYVSAPLHPRNSNLVLVDSALIATGPREYLIGGIGDTLAKWYESRPVFERSHNLSAFDDLSLQSAKLIHATLLSESEHALHALDTRNVDFHFQKIVDTIIGLSGTVGGLGGTKARASGAHSVHDALTVLPSTVNVVHGLKVAYGIMVQLAAEGREDEARELIPFYERVGLPHSLSAVNVDPLDDRGIRSVAEHAVGAGSTFGQAVPGIVAEDVVRAVHRVEELR